MAPVRIPEGSVFVPRRAGEPVAAQLLEAAKEVGADLNLSVRTTTGGYHVFEEVADQYQANLGDDGAAAKAEKKAAKKAAKKAKEAEEAAAAGSTPDAGQDGGQDDGSQGDDGNQEPEPLGVTVDSTRAEIDAYGASLTPPVDTTKAANKPDAIALLEAARTPQTPDAE